MRKFRMTNLVESRTPPIDTKVLWVEREGEDIKVIHRFKNGQWEPYLVSVSYITSNNN